MGKEPLFPPEGDGGLSAPRRPEPFGAAGEDEPDPLDRPDLCVPDGEGDEPDWLFAYPTEPCPCCGAAAPADPPPGYCCPVCGWQTDEDAQDDPDAPSGLNRGLTLTEARLNFRAFGASEPRRLWGGE